MLHLDNVINFFNGYHHQPHKGRLPPSIDVLTISTSSFSSMAILEGCLAASQPSCFSRLLTLTHSPSCQLQLLCFICISHPKYLDLTANTLLYLYEPANILQADCKYSASVSISPRKYFTETDVVKINLIPSSVMGGLFLKR